MRSERIKIKDISMEMIEAAARYIDLTNDQVSKLLRRCAFEKVITFCLDNDYDIISSAKDKETGSIKITIKIEE